MSGREATALCEHRKLAVRMKHRKSSTLTKYEQIVGHPSTDGDEVGIELLIELAQVLLVLGVADEPVDRGEMLTLRQLLIQAPEHLEARILVNQPQSFTKFETGHRASEPFAYPPLPRLLTSDWQNSEFEHERR